MINRDILNCKAGNSFIPTATMTFTNSFTSTPNLGYGISSYQGIYYNKYKEMII